MTDPRDTMHVENIYAEPSTPQPLAHTYQQRSGMQANAQPIVARPRQEGAGLLGWRQRRQLAAQEAQQQQRLREQWHDGERAAFALQASVAVERAGFQQLVEAVAEEEAIVNGLPPGSLVRAVAEDAALESTERLRSTIGSISTTHHRKQQGHI